MLGRPHVSFGGLGHGPHQPVDCTKDIAAGDLCEMHDGSSDCLVAPLLLLVQQLLLRLVQGQFRLYSGGVRGVEAFYTVALYHVLRAVFLADSDGLFLTVVEDVHAEGSRHVVHIGCLKPIHQLLLGLVEQSLAGAKEQNAVHVERLDDEVSLVLVDVHARIRLERADRQTPRPPCRTSSLCSARDHSRSS